MFFSENFVTSLTLLLILKQNKKLLEYFSHLFHQNICWVTLRSVLLYNIERVLLSLRFTTTLIFLVRPSSILVLNLSVNPCLGLGHCP